MRNREVLRQDFTINRASDCSRHVVIPAGDYTAVRQMTLISQFAFSATMSWSNLVQYDNISEKSRLQQPLHWIPRAG